MAKYLSYGGLEKVWGLAKNYFPTVKTATVNGTEVTWTTNTGVSAGNVATFAVDANGLVSLTGITTSSLASSHTHALSIAADSGTSALNMSANTTYKLTAGGSTFIFKTPAHQAHQTLGLIVAATASSNSESGTRGNDTTFVNLLGGGTLKDSVQFTGSGSVSVSGANGKVTITGSHQDWGLVAAGLEGTANVTTATSDPYVNLVKGATPTFDSGVQLKGSNNVTVSANSGVITISGKANTVTGSSLTANQIILGNNSSAVKASGKTIVEDTIGSDNTTIPTSKAVAAAISSATSGLSGAMHFVGTSTSTMTDGQTTNPTVSNVSSFSAGDVVVDSTETEFVLGNEATPKWHKLGDAKSYALSSVSITGTGALGGGGTLASNRTITHNTSALGITENTSYGPTADVTGNNNSTIKVPQITVDKYGHITAVTERTFTAKNTTYTVGSKLLKLSDGTNTKTAIGVNENSSDRTVTFSGDTWVTPTVGGDDNAATVSFAHGGPGTGTDLAATNTDTTTYTNGGEYTVVTGVTITKDSKGHVTGLKETRQKIKSSIATPAAPGAGVLQVVANSGTSGIATPFTANVGSNTIGLNFINGTHTTAVVTAVSGKAPTITFNHNSAGTGTDLAATNTDTTTYTNGSTYDVVTGVTITKDSLGHVTGIKETRQRIKSDGGQTSNVTTAAFVANSTSATSATAAGTTIANGSLYYVLREGSTNTATLITGSGGTTVTKDGNGTNRIIITSPEVAEITEAEINTVCVI